MLSLAITSEGTELTDFAFVCFRNFRHVLHPLDLAGFGKIRLILYDFRHVLAFVERHFVQFRP